MDDEFGTGADHDPATCSHPSANGTGGGDGERLPTWACASCGTRFLSLILQDRERTGTTAGGEGHRIVLASPGAIVRAPTGQLEIGLPRTETDRQHAARLIADAADGYRPLRVLLADGTTAVWPTGEEPLPDPGWDLWMEAFERVSYMTHETHWHRRPPRVVCTRGQAAEQW